MQKPSSGTVCIESTFGEEIDMKNHVRIEKFPDPISKREVVSKLYVGDNINDASVS